jgi:diacylglycerol kinase (ATP)
MHDAPDPLFVIVNPQSGSIDEKTVAEMRQALDHARIEYELAEVAPGSDVEDLARDAVARGFRRIVAGGGDGTLLAIANGIRDTGEECELALIPGGTANLVASALAIPADPDEALEVALRGDVMRLDLGECGGRCFVLGLGVGLAERMIAKTDERRKAQVGRIAYAWAALQDVGAKPQPYVLHLDGLRREVDAVAVVVANVGGITENVKFAPDAQPDDGLLDVCVLHRFDAEDALSLGVSTLAGKLQEEDAISYYPAREIRIEAQEALPVQMDGDETDLRTPLDMRVLPGALRLRVPSQRERR